MRINQRRLNLCLWAMLMAPSFIYADTSLYCASSGSFIKIGDTTQQVQQTCGQPSSVDETKNKPDEAKYQLWSYRGRVTSGSLYNQNTMSRYGTGSVHTGPTITFKIANNKVEGISANNQQLQETRQCISGQLVRLGDSSSVVQQRCGNPITVTQGHSHGKKDAPKVIKWTYQDPYTGSVHLTFESNRLSNIQRKATGQ